MDQPQLLTPEQIQFFMRLEGIFMPHARKQRDELYAKHYGPGQPPPDAYVRFVHYTSAEAALSIIKTKRIWMRNSTCMSDYREVQHGFDILRSFFSNEANKRQFVTALDQCATGVATEAINLFDQWWDTTRFDTYITSIAEHDAKEDLNGRLSMWRAFGGQTARVAIVLKVPWHTGGAAALQLLFSPVAYMMEEEAHAVIRDVIHNIDTNRDFLRGVDRQVIVNFVFNTLLAGVTCLKHDGFKEEREWRAIYSPKRLASPLMESSTVVIGGVPQLVYKVPLDESVSPVLAGLEMSRVFDRLIIGPSPYPVAMYQAFVEALSGINVPDPGRRVFISGIPIRLQ
jgi:hypothetical protein